MTSPIIGTWFVSDGDGEQTYFPQIGALSSAPAAQAIYWRCVAVFYASSLAQSPDARHLFFTNAPVPVIDGVDLRALFERWDVEIVTLPITFRLPAGTVDTFGNQFYIFDVIEWLSSCDAAGAAIILDSDCLWRQPVAALAKYVETHGLAAYRLGADEYPDDALINGLSRQGMAAFQARHGGEARRSTPYYGGEIYAARQDVSARICARARALWPSVIAGEADAPKEEAHLLSIIYALENVENDGAGSFIRRMWTTFHHNNIRKADDQLAIWHLPAEKRTGFRDLFDQIAAQPMLHPARNAKALGLVPANYNRAMGVPRRTPRKFVRDLGLKVKEKIA